ncbi:GIY-YIG nuclease family protein [Asticcacaulis sp.]|uniref:GIY-YIG nuclease family protein n=1 Tax=Asticcacaulis sp. TaxID=1872648 RepID=UPI002632B80D|nr:GIY-YIG nuclease family protein [Asticcacaulis sp.]
MVRETSTLLTSCIDTIPDYERSRYEDAYGETLGMLRRAGEVTDYGCIYILERRGDSNYYKAGLTSIKNLRPRMQNLQTGDPLPQRVRILCIFPDREAANLVETALKNDYQSRGFHSDGGTEWYCVEPDQIVSDVRRLTGELVCQDIKTKASDGKVAALHGNFSTFFGCAILKITENGLLPYDQQELLSKRQVANKQWTEIVMAAQNPNLRRFALRASISLHFGKYRDEDEIFDAIDRVYKRFKLEVQAIQVNLSP